MQEGPAPQAAGEREATYPLRVKNRVPGGGQAAPPLHRVGIGRALMPLLGTSPRPTYSQPWASPSTSLQPPPRYLGDLQLLILGPQPHPTSRPHL